MSDFLEFIKVVGFPGAVASFLGWMLYRHLTECADARREMAAALRLVGTAVVDVGLRVSAMDGKVGNLLAIYDIPWSGDSPPPAASKQI